MHRRLLILWSCIALTAGLAASAATTVHVQSGPDLAAAISDSAVGRIVVDGPIRLEAEHFSPNNVPIRLSRNLTITADAAGPHQVIDFNAREVRNKISIGTGYNLSLFHLTLKETRYGPGADVDILAASPGGILYLTDTAKLQMSCGALVKKQILAYVRDDEVPGVNDIGFPPSVVWNNVTYVDPIVYKDFSTRMGMGENVADRGYIVHKRYSWKLCANFADPACVAAADIPTCVRRDQDASNLAAHPPSDSSAGLSPGAKAGIGVAAAVGALLLLASAFCVVRKARAAKARQQRPLLPTTEPNGSKPMARGSSDSFEKGGGDFGGRPSPPHSIHSLDSTPASRGCGDSLDSLVRSGLIKPAPGTTPVKPRPAGMPSILRGTLTEEQAADVHLGMLVGAGSYGRVFAGKLGTQDVAIKVLHHDDATAQEVASEVAMMMRFKHANLVKAYHYITWGTAGLSNRLTCPDDRERDDAAWMRSGLSRNLGGSSGVDSGSIASSDILQRRPNRMLETWIICELCNAGNLQDAVLLRDHSVFFEGDTPQMGIILQTLLGVAKGMACLHASNVLHGDLKAANVLLCVSEQQAAANSRDQGTQQGSQQTQQQDVELEPKVSDFGLSRAMGEGKTHHSTCTMGTITHQAPELMKSGRLSKAADVFSFGVIMWEMFHAAHPWKGFTMGEVMSAVMIEGRRLIWGTGVPKAYAALAEQCWQTESDARPCFPRLVCTLQDLLQKHEVLQAEVDKSCKRIGTWE